MTDGIGRIFGGNSYGVGGYVPQRNGEEAPQNTPAQAPVINNEAQVDPAKVMDFLASSNIFAPQKTSAPAELDLETQDRIGDYMAQFENYYALIVDEFGEENAPMVMDLVMDKLMGMVA